MALSPEQAEKLTSIPAYQLTMGEVLRIAPFLAIQDALIAGQLPPAHRMALQAMPGFSTQDLALRQTVQVNQELLEAIRDLHEEIRMLRLGVNQA